MRYFKLLLIDRNELGDETIVINFCRASPLGETDYDFW